MTAWCLQQALLTLRDMDAEDAAPTWVSVNVTGAELDGSGLLHATERALLESGLPAERLMIEVTETQLAPRVATARQTFAALRRLGVRVAIDDFGSPEGSLALVRQLEVDCLKIGRDCVQALDTERSSRFACGLVAFGKQLGITMCAVGVEQPSQRALLERAGCDWLQGYLLGRPSAAHEYGLERSPSPARRWLR